MPKYIDADAFVKENREWYCAQCEKRKGMKRGRLQFVYEIGDAPCRACYIDDMISDIEDLPAADVEPVRYGYNVKWDYPTLFECSLCGWECFDTVPGDTNTYQYCPNCGAKMLSEPPNPKSQKGEYNA